MIDMLSNLPFAKDVYRSRSQTFGAILRRIDYHAAHLGAGHAAQFERAEFDASHLGKTFDHLQAIAALVDEAKQKLMLLAPTSVPGGKEVQP